MRLGTPHPVVVHLLVLSPARADSYVSLAVVATAVVVALGLPIADPLIGLAITAVILKITLDSWRTVRGHSH